MLSPTDALEELKRGGAQIISEAELLQKLEENRPLRVKLGVDPTAPDLHLGHTVALTKLRQFQDLGHVAVLIIGDFTSMLGDPSGRSSTRPILSYDEVVANAKTYQEQAFKVLDRNRSEIVFNGDWFRSMPFMEVIRLNSRVTLQQMLQREDFKARVDGGLPVFLHELQYPIMQGWDSVMVRADVELGGTDQLFNIMVGRNLQKDQGQAQQVALLLPILEGLDGVQKMSKSLNNYVGINESPADMFGKLMSVTDQLMARYYEVLLNRSLPRDHPMDAKKQLAVELVTRFHGALEARNALEDFETRFTRRDLGSAELPELPASDLGLDIVSAVVTAYAHGFNLAKSRSEVRRLIEQGSIQWRGEKITDPKAQIRFRPGEILKLDKTRAVRLV
jgi:tyrosyl-tRNA synthetase